MAGRCHHFVQNAWKKDLCSNCFKSKEEHEANGAASSDGKSRYQSTLYSSRPYSWRRTEAVVQSILKDTQQLPKKAKGSTVRFPAEESEVIGYGGEENFSSDGEDSVELPEGSTASDEEEEGEEAKALQRLTQDNTDFNTFTANLLGEKQTRSSGRVMLGKPLTDSEGRRQTLQVTITPFGGCCDTSIAANRKSHFNKLLHDGTEDAVLLKSATKLNDALSSLEEVCKKSCVEKDETKDTANSIPLETNGSKISDEKPVCQTSNENNESSEHNSTELFNESEIQQDSVVKENKLHISEHKQETLPSTTQEAKTSGESDSSEGKASRIPLSKSRLPTEKSKPVIRTTAFNGKLDLHGKSEDVVPKPTIRKTVDVIKKTEPEKCTEPEVVKMKSCPLTETVPVKDSEVSATSSFGDSGTKTDAAHKDVKKMQSFIFSNKSTLHSTQILTLKKTESIETKSQEHKTKVSGQDTNNCATGNFAHVIAKPAIVESKETGVVCKLSSFANVDSPLQSLQLNKLSKFSSDVPSPEKEVKETTLTPSESCVPSETKTSSVREDGSNKTSLALQGISKLPPVLIRRCDDSMFNAEQHSRELAGEPDGRADPDEPTEPPALPRSPPPIIDPRPSFLHGASSIKQQSVEKPKIPTKPNKVLQAAGRQPAYLQNLSSSVCQTPQKEVCEPPLESPVSERRTPLKRQAPKPPPTPTEEHAPVFVVHKLPAGTGTKCQAPVAREKGKRERASSCSPKMRAAVSQSPQGPETSSQRSPLSVSVESLSTTEPEAKKSRSKPRFSLRKFLRLGSNKGEHSADVVVDARKPEDPSPAAPTPRPRLEIIHPLNLNGLEVEVVGGDGVGVGVKKVNEDSGSTSSSSSDYRESEIPRPSSGSTLNLATSGRPNKPPPPPRNHVLDAWGRSVDLVSKPMRPPPPKSAEILHKQKLSAHQPPVTTSPTDTVYANIGEVRLGLVPSKPQRTASIRDANTEGPKRKMASSKSTEDSGYESVEIHEKPTTHSTTLDEGENLYESVSPMARSSSPECDSNTESTQHLKTRYANARRSDGCMEMSPEYLKFRGNFVRSTSLPYCGSETESDIYSPYSFCGSEDIGDDDDWNSNSAHSWRISKLRMRKGRSIVHKNLEDNYGAVVVANHEALAQVLEQMNQGPAVPPALRVLKTAANLCWADFNISEDSHTLVVGRRAFHAALWGSHAVTLCVTQDQGMHCTLPAKGCFTLGPLAEFCDLVPAKYLPSSLRSHMQLVQACVTVLPRLQLHTIQSYASLLRERAVDECTKSGCFVLLQLVNALKLLQAQGTEETPASLSNFVLCGEERLCVLPGVARPHQQEEKVSLCQCAMLSVKELLPEVLLRHLVTSLLGQERATSLSQVKSVLEFSLWGPADIVLDAERELALQRWLDLERATVLHGLVRTRVDLTPFEECHLLFLVRTSAKMMREASVLLDSQSKPEITNF